MPKALLWAKLARFAGATMSGWSVYHDCLVHDAGEHDHHATMAPDHFGRTETTPARTKPNLGRSVGRTENTSGRSVARKLVCVKVSPEFSGTESKSSRSPPRRNPVGKELVGEPARDPR